MLKKKLLTDKSGQLYEDMINQAAENMANDIDFQILTDMLIADNNWSKVVLTPMTWEQSDAVDLWIMKNVKGKHMNRGLVWVFENPAEATWFRMRWSS